MAAPVLLLGLLLIASAATADDELPHLELPGMIPDSGCAHGSDAPPPQGLMDIMSTSGCGSFAVLVAATPNASAVFEERVAAGGGGLTVFCPDDKAVAAFEPTFRALADKDRLAFLLRHGAAGRYGRARFAGFESVTLPTLAVAEKRHTVHAFERGDTMWLWPAWREDGVCSGVASTVTKTVSWEEPNLVLHVVDAVILRVREKLDGGGEEAAAEAASGGYYLGWLHHRVPFWWVLLQQLVSTIVGGILGGACWAGRSV